MLSELGNTVLAVTPWFLLAACVMQLYRSARLYLKTRLVTAQLFGIFALGIAFGFGVMLVSYIFSS